MAPVDRNGRTPLRVLLPRAGRPCRLPRSARFRTTLDALAVSRGARGREIAFRARTAAHPPRELEFPRPASRGAVSAVTTNDTRSVPADRREPALASLERIAALHEPRACGPHQCPPATSRRRSRSRRWERCPAADGRLPGDGPGIAPLDRQVALARYACRRRTAPRGHCCAWSAASGSAHEHIENGQGPDVARGSSTAMSMSILQARARRHRDVRARRSSRPVIRGILLGGLAEILTLAAGQPQRFRGQ